MDIEKPLIHSLCINNNAKRKHFGLNFVHLENMEYIAEVTAVFSHNFVTIKLDYVYVQLQYKFVPIHT